MGAGSGAFTLALADLLGPSGRIVAVDRDAGALAQNAEAVESRFKGFNLEALVADFTAPLHLPPLDGLVAANSLHFVPRDQQVQAIRRLAGYLRPGGRFVIVEYEADHGNPWVPHPFRASTWADFASAADLTDPRSIHRIPSHFLNAIYSAVATRH
jgi:SAM-dependent methyltransferase